MPTEIILIQCTENFGKHYPFWMAFSVKTKAKVSILGGCAGLTGLFNHRISQQRINFIFFTWFLLIYTSGLGSSSFVGLVGFASSLLLVLRLRWQRGDDLFSVTRAWTVAMSVNIT